VFHDQVAPDLVQVFTDEQVPVDSGKKRTLIFVYLRDLESRNLAPGTGRVVAVLQPLGGEDKSSEEHAPAALQDPASVRFVGLLHGEVMGRDVRLDQDQIIESHLQCRVARARTAQSLLDELSQRQDTVAGAKVGAAWH
jgi:hypothetical protein